MREACFDGTAAGWRTAARALLAAAVAPERVAWRVADDVQGALGLADPTPAAVSGTAPGQVRVPRAFLAVVERVACHRAPDRWHRLYRALWRIAQGEPHLLDLRTDPDVRPLVEWAKAVDREVHRMHAFVRFRCVDGPEGPAYVAWFEPAHDVLALAVPLFARRFAAMRWAILTPTASARWDGTALALGPGALRPPEAGDDAEALWRTYYAHVFNPARANAGALRAELPPRYWRNLPEATLIPELLREAPGRVREMIERARDERARAAGPDAEPPTSPPQRA